MLKPPGMTSHDVVAFIRHLLGVRRVGHTGTLDPGVPGVLPIALGRATRLVEYQLALSKSYRFEITFGITTATLDAFGPVLADSDVSLKAGVLMEALTHFTGEILQVPPMVSALKHKGKRLYDLARKGIEVEREPRKVSIHHLELKRFFPGDRPRALIDVTCSSGTYIRSLCGDIGEYLGCGAHMSYLVRIVSGCFRLEDSLALEEISALSRTRTLMLEPLVRGVEHLSLAVVPDSDVPRLAKGLVPDLRTDRTGLVRLMSESGQLLAVAEARQHGITLRKVLAGGSDESNQKD